MRLKACGLVAASLAAGLVGLGVVSPAVGASTARSTMSGLGARPAAVRRVRETAATSTVWLCRPGAADDPCAAPLAATVVNASGQRSVVRSDEPVGSKFDCFYVYPTVSQEGTTNSDLKVQKAEIAVAFAQASRFSQVCRVWAPMYHQVTASGLVASEHNPAIALEGGTVAYQSIRSGLEDYLAHYNDGRPVVFIGHSQGAAMLILLLEHLVENDAALRNRLVMALILGGNVQVRTGSLEGGSFTDIPLCSKEGEAGCVIAYSSFPGTPPAASVFGRPGQGVSLQSGQFTAKGQEVACVNPAALGGGAALLEPYFPALGTAKTLWLNYPGLYRARCEHADGATWLEVSKATGPSDHRPLVTQALGATWGYHADDVNLALGNLVADVAAAETTWSASH